MAKAASGRKRTNAWKIPELEKRVTALIREGFLLKDGGEKLLVETVAREFAEQLTSSGLKFTITNLKARLQDLIWTKQSESDLWRFHGNGMMARFREMYSWIPARMVDARERKLKGVTHNKSHAEFKAGMGRLSADSLPRDAGNYEFPHISYAEPYVVSEESEGQLLIINGALVGIKYPEIEANTLRRALAHARKCKAKAVVLTNLMDIWTKKTAGFLTVYRNMVSGIGINPKRFPPDYQQEVADILSGAITDKLIYQTLNEQFEEIIDGLHKITHRKLGQDRIPGARAHPVGSEGRGAHQRRGVLRDAVHDHRRAEQDSGRALDGNAQPVARKEVRDGTAGQFLEPRSCPTRGTQSACHSHEPYSCAE